MISWPLCGARARACFENARALPAVLAAHARSACTPGSFVAHSMAQRRTAWRGEARPGRAGIARVSRGYSEGMFQAVLRVVATAADLPPLRRRFVDYECTLRARCISCDLRLLNCTPLRAQLR